MDEYAVNRAEMMELILTELAPLLDSDAYRFSWRSEGVKELPDEDFAEDFAEDECKIMPFANSTSE